uniref:Nischarin-like n=1 Tax=Hirondellea gigas TaxID=1518452 RepID=A0A2P2IAE4_9CRUS
MAYLSEENKLEVEIPSATVAEDYTNYEILVRIGPVEWFVSHRYSDFKTLHQHLTTNHGVAKHLLPPKKIIGNKDPVFIQKRRFDLQVYLQGVVALMQQAIVDELAEFLSLCQYEVLYLRQHLATTHCNIRQGNDQTWYSTLELHAISDGQCRGLPEHAATTTTTDFCNVADAAGTVQKIHCSGSWENWRRSNIIPNELEFNFNLFKKLHTLLLRNCNVLKINNASTLRKTIVLLNAHACNLTNVSDILLCDSVHRDLTEVDDETLKSLPKWLTLRDLNLSNNKITSIDLSISLCNRLETINLSGNKLTSLEYLTKLPYLISVVVSNNCIVELPDLHTRLGNLVHLDLSRNKMVSLRALACLYSLVSLDVSSNLVVDVNEVHHVAKLPCLEDFILTGNPVSTIVDYRTKVMECFGNRCSELCLDNERPTQRELDKVAVLQALRAAREGSTCRLPTLSIASPLSLRQSHNTSITGLVCVCTAGSATAAANSVNDPPDVATAVEEATKFD